MAPTPALTPARRAVAAALLFLAAATLAGITTPASGDGVRYHTFGLVEGVLALLLSYILVARGAWLAPRGVAGWVALAYGTVASAQLWELLLPPPGVLEWGVVVTLALVAWGALAGGTRQRLVASLASLALLLALLKFSVIPVLWERAGPAAGTGFGIGDVAEGFRRLLVAEPPAAGGPLVGFLALCAWVLGTYLLWPVVEAEEADGTLRERIERALGE